MPIFGPSGRHPMPGGESQSIFSRDFILLFCMSLCNNSYIAVYYCFEQWLEGVGVAAGWRGILLSCMFVMVLLCRPLASFTLLKRSKLVPLGCAIILSSSIMLAYPFLAGGPHFVGIVAGMRALQGVALSVYSTCVTAVLVSCIPKGQSARGFALFSLTLLLPYSIIPALGEHLLPLVGGEPYLFAWTSLLGIPALCMLIPLAPRLRIPELPAAGSGSMNGKAVLHAVTHSGLSCIYLACLTFSIMTWLAILFMKGLCTLTGAQAQNFFMTYTVTMILIRLFGSHMFDTLPRYRVVPLCALGLAVSMAGMAWLPSWAFIPLCALYGVCLGVLYPLLASTIYDRSTDATRSINSSVMMLTFDASGMLGPLVGGAVIQLGLDYRGVFMTAALIVSMSGGFMLLDRLRLALEERRQRAGA